MSEEEVDLEVVDSGEDPGSFAHVLDPSKFRVSDGVVAYAARDTSDEDLADGIKRLYGYTARLAIEFKNARIALGFLLTDYAQRKGIGVIEAISSLGLVDSLGNADTLYYKVAKLTERFPKEVLALPLPISSFIATINRREPQDEEKRAEFRAEQISILKEAAANNYSKRDIQERIKKVQARLTEDDTYTRKFVAKDAMMELIDLMRRRYLYSWNPEESDIDMRRIMEVESDLLNHGVLQPIEPEDEPHQSPLQPDPDHSIPPEAEPDGPPPKVEDPQDDLEDIKVTE